MKKQLLWQIGLVVGLFTLQGCQDDSETTARDTAVTGTKVEAVEALNSKNIYSSVALGDNTVLMAGENGMLITNIDTDGVAIKYKKQFKSAGNTFNIPKFKSYEQLSAKSKKTDDNETNTSEETPAIPKIYSMFKLSDGLLIGGKFATVNGVAKDNLVKLKYDGSIDNDFNGSAIGAVYKIMGIDNNIYVAGAFGGYNDGEAYGIVKIDSEGTHNQSFLPFAGYTLVKINDMETYDTDKLILAGTFVKEIGDADENSTKEELLTMTRSILIIDQQGNILEEESNKFSDIRNETFSVVKDDNRMYIAGDFDFTKNDKSYNNLVAYSLDGVLDEAFQIEKLNGMIFDVALDNDKIIFGGDFIAEEDNSTNRSFYVVDKSGVTIKIDNLISDADIYNIDVYNGRIIISGEGEFKVNDQSFADGIMLKIN